MRIVLLVALLLTGCASPKTKSGKKPDKPKKQEEQNIPDQITTQAGSLVYRPPGSGGKPLWSVGWEEAELRMKDQKLGGTLHGLSGVLYGKEGEASRFTAETGQADQTTGNLTLNGQVVVRSIEQKASLRCDEVRYASKGQRLIRAHGGVNVEGPWGTVSGLEDVLTTPDLKTFATPDLFPTP